MRDGNPSKVGGTAVKLEGRKPDLDWKLGDACEFPRKMRDRPARVMLAY